jgi:hypothetical protein
MAERPGRPGRGRPERGRPERGRPERGKPERGKPERGKTDRGGSKRGRSEPGAAGGGQAGRGRAGGRPAAREGTRGSALRGTGPRGSGARGQQRRTDRGGDATRTDAQREYDGPPIPEHVTGRELDRSVAAALKSLPDKLAQRVARHLVAAGLALADDPRTAYEHTLAARARAGRLAVVREAVGEAAYAAGEYAEALQELRAARRMNGSTDYLAVMADCERALGRPDRALTLLRSAPRERMAPDQRAELTIVEAGARRDRGELDAALRVLEQAPLDSRSRAAWVARLRYMYADTLAEAGRSADALEWFHRTDAVDGEGLTDAAERAAALES